MDEKLLYLMAVSFINGIGPRRIRELQAALGDVSRLFTEPAEQLKKIPAVPAKYLTPDSLRLALLSAEHQIEYMKKHDITPLMFTDACYPFRLKECSDAPAILYVKGSTDLNKGVYLGVVGTRHITPYGRTLCENFIDDLAAINPNVTIVSGLAFGVDIVSHRSALEHKLNTVAVLGNGLDTVYPAAHTKVARTIEESGGALVTEYAPHAAIDASCFIQRNRIIAGLSDAVLVVESAVKGGALFTAKAARDYGRAVFAFPGRVGDVYSAGCNSMIKKGEAFLIDTAQAMTDQLNWNIKKSEPRQQLLFNELSEDEQSIITLLHASKRHIDDLKKILHFDLPKLLELLVKLEFEDVIRPLPGNMYELKQL